MGETRKVYAYPQLATQHFNAPLMKEAQNDDRYKVWVQKPMTKREDKTLLHKIYHASLTYVVGVASIFGLVVPAVAAAAVAVFVAPVVVVVVGVTAINVLFLLR